MFLHLPATDATEAQQAALDRIVASVEALPPAYRDRAWAQVRAWAAQELARRIVARQWPAANDLDA
jgi:hypothetical protein